MKLFVDDAKIEVIQRLYSIYPLDGVTTNPTILSKTGENPGFVLKQIREFIGKDLLFVQTISDNSEEMILEAHSIVRLLGENTVVKIPVIPDGVRAITQLNQEGVLTCGTIVYSISQAFLAAKAGADYIAPYVNRIDNTGLDGLKAVYEMQEMITRNGFSSKLLGASFRNRYQVSELIHTGNDACTLAPDILENLLWNPAVDLDVSRFQEDFSSIMGKPFFQ